MSKQSKHERVIREELDSTTKELAENSAKVARADEELRKHKATADEIRGRICMLERLLDRADADKTGGDDD